MEGMTLMRVTATDYFEEDDEVVVQVAGRDESGDRRTLLVDDTEPWVFVPADETIPTKDTITIDGNERQVGPLVTGVERGYESFDGHEAKKLKAKTPKAAGAMADLFTQSWESDIPYYRRVTMRDGLSGYIRVPDKPRVSIGEIDTEPDAPDEPIKPRVVIGDIEVIPTRQQTVQEMVENAEQKVTNISLYDSYDDEYTELILSPNDGYEFDLSRVKEELEGHWQNVVDSSEVDKHTSGINVEICSTEEALLTQFIEYVEEKRPDLLSGWNWVDFDHRYLINRMRVLEEKWGQDGWTNYHRLSDIGRVKRYARDPGRLIEGLPGFDMMDAVCEKMRRTQPRSKALDFIAEEELGVGKVAGVSVRDAFQDDRERLAAYNLIDTQLCVMLDEKNGVHDFFYSLAELSQIQIYDTFSEMRLVDGFIISRRGKDEVLPPQEEKDLDDNSGGLVLTPFDGIEEWVSVFDVKSLYPSAMITWNISTETIEFLDDRAACRERFGGVPEPDIEIPRVPDPEEVSDRDVVESDIDWGWMGATLEREGIIPKYLKLLFDEREERKGLRNQYEDGTDAYQRYDRQQAAVKVIMNSFYGVSSNDYWRLSREGMGDAITSAARYTLWVGQSVAKERGYDVIYGDTDSIMVSLGDEGSSLDGVADAGWQLVEQINSQMDRAVADSGLDGPHPFLEGGDLHGTERHCLVFEFEKVYRRYLQAAKKKRYAGLTVMKDGNVLDEPTPDVTGFESRRSSSPILTARAMPEVIGILLKGGGFDEVSAYIREAIQAMENVGDLGDLEFEQFDVEDFMAYHLAFPGTINKPFKAYDTTNPTIRAAEYSNEELGYDWGPGDDPWVYPVSKTPPMKGTDVIALDWNDDIPEGYELDVREIIEKALESPLEPVFTIADFDFSELKTGASTMDAMNADWDGGASWADDEDDSDSDEGGALAW